MEAGRSGRRSLRNLGISRYLLAVSLLILGIAFAFGVALGAAQVKSNRAMGFARVDVPGALTLHVAQPATYYIYSEGTTCLDYPNCHGAIYPVTLTVTDPTGDVVRVQASPGPNYVIGAMGSARVAAFNAATTGNYRVTASTGPYSEGQIAVGQAFPWWTQDYVAWLVMVVMWVGGVLIIVLPLVMRRPQTR